MAQTRIDGVVWSVRTRPGALALACVALSFLLPKAYLVEFFGALWLSLGPGDLLQVCLQDLAVAVGTWAVLDAFLAYQRGIFPEEPTVSWTAPSSHR